MNAHEESILAFSLAKSWQLREGLVNGCTAPPQGQQRLPWLHKPLPPLSLAYSSRALESGQFGLARELAELERCAAHARASSGVPCTLSPQALLDSALFPRALLADIADRMTNGVCADLGQDKPLGAPIRMPNSPSCYFNVTAFRALVAKSKRKGRLIASIDEAGTPRLMHFLSPLSASFKFESYDQRRKFDVAVKKILPAAKQMAALDLHRAMSSATPSELPQLEGSLLEGVHYKSMRIIFDTSRPEGNVNTRGLLEADCKLKYDSLRDFGQLLRPGDMLFVHDIEGAFPSLINDVRSLILFGCSFEGSPLIADRLTLGTRAGPHLYDSCLGAPLHFLAIEAMNSLQSDHNVTLKRFVDDFFGMIGAEAPPNLAMRLFACLKEAADRLGVSMSTPKELPPLLSCGAPRTNLERLLGMGVATVPYPAFRIPDDKLQDICYELGRAIDGRGALFAELESVLAKIQCVATAVHGAMPFAADLFLLLNEHRRQGASAFIPLTARVRDDLAFFRDLAPSLNGNIRILSSVDVPRGHLQKDAATGKVGEMGFLSISLLGCVLVIPPPVDTETHHWTIAELELLTATLSSWCTCAVFPGKYVETDDDNKNVVAWLRKGHSPDVFKNHLLRWRWRPLLRTRTREHNVYIPSALNVLADAGTHLNEAKRASGFQSYLLFLTSNCSDSSPPSWWPSTLAPFPPHQRGFVRVPDNSALGLLAQRISSANAQSVQLSGEEVDCILQRLRLQLSVAFHASSI